MGGRLTPMPHDTDVRSTSHDRHDALLVAALAAGDLSGTDRDHATTLLRTCQECASLHDDLVLIARATVAVPPPIATRPRDYRLTAEQAARLRPGGWRRFVGALAGPQFAFSRPLGIALTTIGLAGLLLANVSLPNLGGASASAPMTVGAAVGGSAAPAAADQGAPSSASGQAFGVGSPGPRAPEGSKSGPLTLADGQTLGAVMGSQAADTTARARTLADTASNGSGGNGASGAPPSTTAPVAQAEGGRLAAPASSPDLRTVVFALVVLAGLALLVLRRVAQRTTSA